MIINLITDLGTTDHYLAKLKLSILNEVQAATFVDTAHNIAPYDISLAAYHLSSLVKASPAGTLHLVSVHSHYDKHARHVAFTYLDQHFIGPDNGVFFLAFPQLQSTEMYEVKDLLKEQVNQDYYQLYAHASSLVDKGEVWSDHYILLSQPLEKISIRPGVGMNYIRGTIEQVDHYGNVITNISRKLFERESEGRRYAIHYHPGDPVTRICTNYSEVGVDDVVCLWNENDKLEIAVNMGQASTLLNLHRGDTIQIDLL